MCRRRAPPESPTDGQTLQGGLTSNRPVHRSKHSERARCYKHPVILAIETSCDDTCAAVVEPDGRRALSNVDHPQTKHERYGGVVPIVASRPPLEVLDGVIDIALAAPDTDIAD